MSNSNGRELEPITRWIISIFLDTYTDNHSDFLIHGVLNLGIKNNTAREDCIYQLVCF